MNKHLYDSIAANWLSGTGTVWIISDPHFGDLESYKFRGLVDEHADGDLQRSMVSAADEMQIKRINGKVGKKDTLIILGDIGDVECVKKLRGHKVLIMGNHDKGASNYKRDYGQYHTEDVVEIQTDVLGPGPLDIRKYRTHTPKLVCDREDNHLFDEVYEGPLMVSDRLILSHEPIYPLPPYMYNIHGHVHSQKGDDAQHKNVCAEHVGYTPVNLMSMLNDGLLSAVDSIHEITIDLASRRKKNVD